MKKKLLMYFAILIFIFSIAVPSGYGTAKGPTISELQKKISELTKQVQDLKNNLSKKSKENDKFKKENATLKKENSNLKEHQTELELQLESNKEEISRLNGYLDERDKNINKIEQLLSAKVIYTDNNLNVVAQTAPNAIKWYGFETVQATIYLTREAFDAYWYTIDISDKIIIETASYFNIKKLPKKIPVFISFNEQIRDQEWAAYPSDEDLIYLIGSRFAPFKNNFMDEGLVQSYVHEMTHAFQDFLNLFSNGQSDFDHNKRWLYEGMAMYLNRQFIEYTDYDIPKDHVGKYKYGVSQYKQNILVAMDFSKNVNLDTITSMSKSTDNYIFYEAIVYYMHQKYGRELVFKFIEEFKHKPLPTALMDSFEVSEEKFMKDWKEYFSIN